MKLHVIKAIFICLLALFAGLTGYMAYDSHNAPKELKAKAHPGIPEGVYLRKNFSPGNSARSFSCGPLWRELGAELRVRKDTLCASGKNYTIEKGETPRQFFACSSNPNELLTEFLLIRPGHLRFLCGRDSAVYVLEK